jgi:hypothetical protein
LLRDGREGDGCVVVLGEVCAGEGIHF